MRSFSVVALASTLALLKPCLVDADTLSPLPSRAVPIDLKYQPVMDFDKDSCYNTAAVDVNGDVNNGLNPSTSGTKDCRNVLRLMRNNVYSRHMCNRGWCAIIYAYYFEMDSVDLVVGNAGHRHDWEHVVVWVKNNVVRSVATSAHGNFDIHPGTKVRFQDTHPKIVYHMDWKRTRTMRLAEAKDDKIENEFGVWFLGALVDWSGFPSYYLRDQLLNHDFGSAHMQFSDAEIGGKLAKSMPQDARNEGFDCAYNDGSHW